MYRKGLSEKTVGLLLALGLVMSAVGGCASKAETEKTRRTKKTEKSTTTAIEDEAEEEEEDPSESEDVTQVSTDKPDAIVTPEPTSTPTPTPEVKPVILHTSEITYLGNGGSGGRREYDYDSEGRILTKRSTHWDDVLHLDYEYTYDEQGNLLVETVYLPEGGHYDVLLCEYDENGNEIYREEYVYLDNLKEKIEREFDDNSNELLYKKYGDNGLEIWEEYKYDNTGRIKKTKFDSRGNIASWVEYENEDGNIVKETNYDANGSITSWAEFEYFSNGNTKRTKYYPDGSISLIEEKDPNDKCVQEIQYDENGNVTFEEVHDASGIRIKEMKYESTLKSYTTVECKEYDQYGNPSKFVKYLENGSVIMEWEDVYNEAGQKIKYTISSDASASDDYNYSCEWEYDSDGRQIKYFHYYKNGKIKLGSEYEYDLYGNKIKEISYEAGGKIKETREWEYDSYGNVTKYTILKPDGSIDSWTDYIYTYSSVSSSKGEEYTKTIEKEGFSVMELSPYGNDMVENLYAELLDSHNYLTATSWYERFANEAAAQAAFDSSYESAQNDTEGRFSTLSRNGNVMIKAGEAGFYQIDILEGDAIIGVMALSDDFETKKSNAEAIMKALGYEISES